MKWYVMERKDRYEAEWTDPSTAQEISQSEVVSLMRQLPIHHRANGLTTLRVDGAVKVLPHVKGRGYITVANEKGLARIMEAVQDSEEEWLKELGRFELAYPSEEGQ